MSSRPSTSGPPTPSPSLKRPSSKARAPSRAWKKSPSSGGAHSQLRRRHQHFIPGATLHNQRLRLVAFKTRRPPALLWFPDRLPPWRTRSTPEIEMIDAVSVECRPRNGSSARIFAEADGEILGICRPHRDCARCYHAVDSTQRQALNPRDPALTLGGESGCCS